MKQVCTLLLLVVALCRVASAQADWILQYGLAWNISTPLDRALVQGTSVSGGHFEFLLKPWKAPYMAGLQIDWSTYDTYTPTATYVFGDGNGAITTDYYAYQYCLPLLATVQRHFGKSERFYPWARLGAGGQYSLQQLYYGVFMEEQKTWGFAAKGEAGASLAFSDNIPLMLSLSGGILYATNGAQEFGDSDWLSWQVQLGLVLRQF